MWAVAPPCMQTDCVESQTHSQQQPDAGVHQPVPVSPLLLLLQLYLTLQQEEEEEEEEEEEWEGK